MLFKYLTALQGLSPLLGKEEALGLGKHSGSVCGPLHLFVFPGPGRASFHLKNNSLTPFLSPPHPLLPVTLFL